MSASDFTTRPDPSLPLYFMNPPPPSGLPGYQVGYYATSAAKPAVPLPFANSWNDFTGVYLFLNVTPADLSAFVRRLDELLADVKYANARFLWIENPDALLPEWRVQHLPVTQPGGIVTVLTDLTFRNYRLAIGAESTVALTGDGFSISGGISFTTAVGRYPLTGGGATNLFFAGPQIGCLVFGLTTDDSAFFSSVDSGLRYFVKEPRLNRVRSLHYPVFTGSPKQTIAATFDPSNPLDINRTFLGFPPGGSAIDSCFTTNYGNALQLKPADSSFAPCGPRLVLAAKPTKTIYDPQANFYLAPAGSFTVDAPPREARAEAVGDFTPPATRVQCGAAGIEYLGLQAATGSFLHFFPNQPAYAPDLSQSATLDEGGPRTLTAKGSNEPPLSPVAMTSWLYATPPAGESVVYFAQPDDAALYGATASQYLQFLEVPAGTLKTSGFAETPAFPMVPYSGVKATTVTEYADLETKVLSPIRRDLLAQFATQTAPAAKSAGAANVSGATPQGLLIDLDSSRTQWETLTIAKRGDESLLMHGVHGGMKEALQTNQLFTVMRDVDKVLETMELEYEITDDVIRDLATKLNPVPANVLNLLVPMKGTTYLTRASFDAALQPALGTYYAQYGDEVARYAAKFDLEIESWRFRLSPTMWNEHVTARTICIFKYANRPLQALAEDVTAWTWLEAAGDVAETQAALLQILNDAAASVDASGTIPNDLDYFVRVVMRNPSWNGILFLNANVPLSALPPDLSGLVSGIDPAKFYGHHFGIETTPVQPGTTLTLGDSSLFGLILYDDPEDLYFNGSMYDFKVLLLKVLFANSTITGFASRIELMTNGYFGDFGDLLASEHNNNLILDGSRQLQGDTPTYVYEQEGSNVFVMRSKVLREVEITKSQFVTLAPAEGSVTDVSTKSRFLLWGKLRFNAIQNFDVFSFGPDVSKENVVIADGFLPFANLSIDMASDGTAGGNKIFAFNAKDIAFDTASALARPQSLYAHFPLVLSGLTIGKAGTKPANLGYIPVKTPMTAGPLTDDWYALAFQLDLGTLGALGAQSGFTVSVVAAWSPSENSTLAQVALLLPGGRSLTSVIPIQGVIKLGFSSIDFTAAASTNGIGYMLKFKRFALSLLGMSFPPGQADLYFFGNPNNNDRTAIGWYAAYLK